MLVDIKMPVLGETTEQAEILEWFKQEGETVSRGENLLEVQSDKVTVEVPALETGVIQEIVAKVGETVAVGGLIARLNTVGQPSSAKPKAIKTKTEIKTEIIKTETQTTIAKTPRLRASPAARRLARANSISLETIKGSGPKSRITKADVEQKINLVNKDSEIPKIINTKDSYHFSPAEIIAGKRTTLSFNQSPHFYIKIKIELTKIIKYLKTLEDNRPSINDVLIMATAKTLKNHPHLNSIYKDKYLQILDEINIGVITSTDEGLYTAVVKNAEQLSLGEIKLKVKEIRKRLEQKQAKQADIEGATFTISNLGMFGIDEFSAIILAPNVAIMAVGAAKEEVIVKNGQMHLGKTIICTISADHRAVDGVTVAKFLKELESLVSQPEKWLF